MTMKQCTRCEIPKPILEFHEHKRGKAGVSGMCKGCVNARKRSHKRSPELKLARNARYRKRYKESPGYAAEKLRRQNEAYWRDPIRFYYYNQRKKYGLTKSQIEALRDSQNGVCAICQGSPNGKGNQLHVDHDHKTNAIRGLLCSRCNIGLGHFADDPALLRSAIDYLLRHLLSASGLN